MRREVEERGESIVRAQNLLALCLGEVSRDGQWNAIAQVAIAEGWEFNFLPNASVRFAPREATA